jgi:hypothetical protein
MAEEVDKIFDDEGRNALKEEFADHLKESSDVGGATMFLSRNQLSSF